MPSLYLDTLRHTPSLILPLVLSTFLTSCGGGGSPTFVGGANNSSLDPSYGYTSPPRKTVPVFGRRAKVKIPVSPEPTRTKGLSISRPSAKPKSISPTQIDQAVRSCLNHYETQLPRTSIVLKSLQTKSHSCWSGTQTQEIHDQEQSLITELNQLRQSLKTHTPSRVSPDVAANHYELLKNIATSYHELQENISFCRLSSLVLDDAPITQSLEMNFGTDDDRTLLHLVGEPFGKSSGLEGAAILDGALLQSRQAIYLKIDQVLGSTTYIADRRQAEPCFDIPAAYQTGDDGLSAPLPDLAPEVRKDLIKKGNIALKVISAFALSQKAFQEELKLQIKNLKPSDSFYFQGGSKSHAVVFEISKQNKSALSFRIFNSGDGLNYHGSALNGIATTVFPFVEQVDIREENLLSPVFLTALRDIAVTPEGPDGSKSNMDNLYHAILRSLGGRTTTTPSRFDDFLNPQIAGTCAYYSIPYYHKIALKDRRVADHLEFLIKTSFFDSYLQRNGSRVKNVDSVRRLAKKSLTFLSEETAKHLTQEHSAVDRGMALFFMNQGSIYQNLFEKADEELTTELAKQSPTYDPKKPQKAKEFTTSGFSPYQLLSGIPQNAKDFLFYQPFRTEDLEKWQPQPTSILADLDTFSNVLDKGLSTYSYSQNKEEFHKAILGVQSISRKLPADEEFWSKLDQPDLKNALTQVTNLSKTYFRTLIALVWYAPSSRGISPVEIMTQLRLLTVADIIMQLLAKEDPLLEDFPHMYQRIFDNFFSETEGTSLLTVKDSRWTKPFAEVKQYWKKYRIRGNSFFQFEHYPLFGQTNRLICIDSNRCSDYQKTHWSILFGDPSKLQWNDINWVVDKIKSGKLAIDPKNPSAIANAINQLSSETSKLPRQFFQIRLMSFISHYFIFGSFEKHVHAALPNLQSNASDSAFFKMTYEPRINIGGDGTNGSPAPFYVHRNNLVILGQAFPIATIESKKYGLLGSSSEYYIGDAAYNLGISEESNKLENLKNIITSYGIYDHNDIKISIPYQKISSSSQVAASIQDKESNLTLELYRRVLNFESITNTLAFFQENTHYLRERKWQVIFKKIMFQPGTLEAEFHKTRGLASHLIRFCKENYEQHVKDGDYLTALFYLRMNHLFLEHYQSAAAKADSKSFIEKHPPLFSSRTAYTDLITHQLPQELNRSSSLKNQLFRDLIRTYLHESFINNGHTSLSPEEISWYLIAQIYRLRFPVQDPEDFLSDEENAIEGLHQLKIDGISRTLTALSKPDQDKLLSQVIAFFAGKQPVRAWDLVIPSRFLWKGIAKGSYDVSVQLGDPSILVANRPPTTLPASLLMDKTFQDHVDYDPKIEPLDLGTTWRASYFQDNVYEVMEKSGHRVRVSIGHSSQSPITIQKKWGTRWYQLLSDSEIFARAFPTYGGTADWSVMPGYTNWISISEWQTGIQNSQDTDPPYSGWRHEENETEVLAFDKDTKKLFSVSKISSAGRLTVFKASESGLSHWKLGNIAGDSPLGEQSSLKFLFRFESSRLVWAWMNDQTEELDHIELPRFGLTFVPDPETGSLICKELDSLRLSQVQSIPKWERNPHYLVLEDDTQKKLLFPRHQYLELKSSFATSYGLDLKLPTLGRNSQRYFLFTLDPFTEDLLPNSREAEYFLSMLILWDHSEENLSYAKARNHLYGVGSELGTYLPEELEILQWITQLGNKDNDPRAIALRMGALTLRVRNAMMNHSFFDQAKIKDGLLLYNSYLKLANRISPNWLPEELELSFLTYLNLLYPDKSKIPDISQRQYQARWKELRGEKLGQVQFLAGLRIPPSHLYISSSAGRTWGYQGTSDSSILQGSSLLSHSEDFYEISRMFLANPPQLKERLALLLSKILRDTPEQMRTYSLERLKSEYLSYLKMIIRVEESKNIDREYHYNSSQAVFLFTLATYPYPEFANYPFSYEAYLTGLNANPSPLKNIYQIQEVEQLLATDAPHGPLPNTDTPASASFFWDHRKNPSFSASFTFSYQLDSTYEQYSLKSDPIISETLLKKFIQEVPLSSKRKKAIKATSQELIETFQTKTSDSFVQNYLNGIANKISSREKVALTEKTYLLKDENNLQKELNDLKQSLSFKLNQVMDRIKEKRREILTIAHLRPEDTHAATMKNALFYAAVEEDPQLDTLIRHYANGAFKELFDANPNLSGEDITRIGRHITSYLILSTYYFKLQDVIKNIATLEGDFLTLSDETPLKQDILKNFFQRATQLRSYEFESHPEYLAFEYFMRIILRGDQIQSIHELDITAKHKDRPDAQGILLEMIMGSGKTSVLLPIISHANSKPDQLSIVILPESLIPSMIKEISQKLRDTFGQGVDRLTIQRKDKYDYHKLDQLYQRLKGNLFSKKIVVTSNSSIQSLFLIFIEKLYEKSGIEIGQNDNRRKEIAKLQDIFWLFRNYGYVTIDEIDLIMDIMTSHRFSMGSAVPIERDTIDAAAGLFALVSSDSELQRHIKLAFLPSVNSDAEPFSKESYDAKLKGTLIKRICQNSSASFFFHSVRLKEDFKNLDKQKLRTYFESTNPSEMKAYLDSLKNISIKNVISVLYTEVQQIFPLTASKIYRVHYGMYPKEKCEPGAPCPEFISIPYHGGVPMDGSRFGSDLESLNYTIQSHLEERKAYALLKREYQVLKEKFVKKRSKAVLERVGQIFGNIPTSEFLSLSDADLKAQAKWIEKDQNMDIFLALVKSHAIPQIKVFPNQLQTNAHIYPILFKSIQGVSGTLWNLDSFPNFYEKVILSDTLARTLMVLGKNLKTTQVKVISQAEGGKLDPLLSQVLSNETPLAIIDQGGLFRGMDREKVVRKMAENPVYTKTGLEQIIFYDAQHEIQVFHIGEKTVRPYIPLNAERERHLTTAFWDMEHTTGSDLKVHPNTQAILTVNRFSATRDIAQAAFRLRELELGQSVTFAVAKDDLLFMSKTLARFYGDQFEHGDENSEIHFTLENLFLYLATREAITSGELNFRAVKASLREIIIDSVFDFLLDKTSDLSSVHESFQSVKTFFDNPRGNEPFERYGIPFTNRNPIEYLNERIDRLFGPRAKFFLDPKEVNDLIRKDLAQSAYKLRSEATVPDQGAFETDAEIEIESEVEIEMEVETEQETEVEQEVQIRVHEVDTQFQKPRVLWDKDRFFRGEYFRKMTEKSDLMKPLSEAAAKNLIPTIKMSEILDIAEEDRYMRLFDQDVLTSLNLFPVYRVAKENDPDFKPYGSNQGPMDELLVILNQDNIPLSVVLVTRDEAFQIGDWLNEDLLRETTAMHQDYQVLVYEFGNGFIRVSKNTSDRWDENELKHFLRKLANSDRFLKLVVQAKFLSGRVQYSDNEKIALEAWLLSQDKDQNAWQLLQDILKVKDTTREEFDRSDLDEIFQELKYAPVAM